MGRINGPREPTAPSDTHAENGRDRLPAVPGDERPGGSRFTVPARETMADPNARYLA